MSPQYLKLLIIAATLGVASDVDAQLFGSPRELGSPIQRRQQPGQNSAAGQAAVQAGQVQGSERFLRNNRRRGDFVGSDRFERRTFVGSQQGTSNGPVIQSTTGVRPQRDRSAQVNQAVAKPKRQQAYAPRLVLDASTFPSTGIRQGRLLRQELENSDYFSGSNRYEVLVEGRTAILRGVVADARERDLAELLVSFEPGISAVRNELTTRRSASRTENLDFELPPPAPVPDSASARLAPVEMPAPMKSGGNATLPDPAIPTSSIQP